MKTPKSSTRAARTGCPLFSSCTRNLSFYPSVWFPSVPADLSLRRLSLSTKPQSPWRPSSVSRRRRRSFSSDQNTPTLTRTHPLTPPAPEWPVWLEAAGRICLWWKSRCVYLKNNTDTFDHIQTVFTSNFCVWFHVAKIIRACGVSFFFFTSCFLNNQQGFISFSNETRQSSHIKLQSKQELHSCCCHKRL